MRQPLRYRKRTPTLRCRRHIWRLTTRVRFLNYTRTDEQATTSLAPKLLQSTKQLVAYNAFATYDSLHRLYVEVSELTSVPTPTK